MPATTTYTAFTPISSEYVFKIVQQFSEYDLLSAVEGSAEDGSAAAAESASSSAFSPETKEQPSAGESDTSLQKQPTPSEQQRPSTSMTALPAALLPKTVIESSEIKNASLAINCQSFAQIKKCVSTGVRNIHVPHNQKGLGHLVQRLHSSLRLHHTTGMWAAAIAAAAKLANDRKWTIVGAGTAYLGAGVAVYSTASLAYYSLRVGVRFIEYAVFQRDGDTFLTSGGGVVADEDDSAESEKGGVAGVVTRNRRLATYAGVVAAAAGVARVFGRWK